MGDGFEQQIVREGAARQPWPLQSPQSQAGCRRRWVGAQASSCFWVVSFTFMSPSPLVAARLEFNSWAVHSSTSFPFLSLSLSFFLLWQKSLGCPQPFVFGGEISGNIWSCFLCSNLALPRMADKETKIGLTEHPTFNIFPSGFIDRVPRAVIGEGNMLAVWLLPPRKRISAVWSGVTAQLLSAGQMVWSKLVKMSAQLLCLLVLGLQGCTPAIPQDLTPQASFCSSTTHKFTTTFWSSQVCLWFPSESSRIHTQQ